ncbi:hypothetical protein WJX73_005617 [Symbiochloris irregularis]|uniref:DNA mismatch repair protein n=1 Tax=Symbiochloris irregularis TaxID=706552 RepID=A0AAW1PF47_9CHLO
MMTKAKQPPASGQKSIKSFFSKNPRPPPSQAAPPSQDTKHTSAGPKQAPEKQEPPVNTRTSPRKKASTPAQPAAPAAADEAAAPAKTTAAEVAAEPDGCQLVCKRVSVYWPDDDDWYQGTVKGFNGSKHRIAYDDGEQETVDLSVEKYKIISGTEPEPEPKPEQRSAKRRAAHVIFSDDDDEEMSKEADESPGDSASGSDFGQDEEKEPAKKKAKTAPTPAKATTNKTPASKTPARTAPSSAQSMGKKTPATKTPSAKPAGSSAKLAAMPAAIASSTPAPKGMEASDDWQRYTQRAAQRFPFLAADRVMDANRRRPGHPDWDPRTLHIPPTWFKDAKVSEGQRQWWQFKAQHFDSVMLFKMGKFYEMFEMDAHVGSDVLGLSYMRGEQPHCGFPEANYQAHAERLARAGLRVVVIEQTETPDQLKLRNEERRARGQTKVNVVNRELVAVLTQGTLSDPDMLRSHPDASYLLALLETPAPEHDGGPQPEAGGTLLAACAVDVASGHMLIGQWCDDPMRTRLRALLAALHPAELVLPKAGLDGASGKVLKAAAGSVRTNHLDFEDAAAGRQGLADSAYFDEQGTSAEGKAGMPPLLQGLMEAGDSHDPSLRALAGCLAYLRSVLLDRPVMAMCRPEWLPQSSFPSPGGDSAADSAAAAGRPPACMALDGNALEALEVLEGSSGGTDGSLLGALDRCVTPAGRRLLRSWLCRPLDDVDAITARQDAVHDLMHGISEEMGTARQRFAGVGDLERGVARIVAACAGATGRDAEAVVLYEDAAKRRVMAFVSTLRSLQALQRAMEGLQAACGDMSSTLLQKLVTPGQALPAFAEPLDALVAAADWEEAAAQGRVIPTPGTNAEVDEAEAGLAAVEKKLAGYLKEVKQLLKGGPISSISYVPLHKETHVLEIPSELEKAVPGNWERLAQRKGFSRYMSPALRKLVKERNELLQTRELALSSVLKGLLMRFSQHRDTWGGAVEAMAQLDALASLAAAAMDASANGPVCRPEFIAPGSNKASDTPAVFRARQLRHPAAACGGEWGSFVPNDVCLGGEEAPFILLTGPNMGGKSTLLRQVCLAVVMAQAGAWVPAESLQLTPTDALFVRSGARDAIMSGQSTFFVELAETAAALHRASARSLVALDELGRGTSTSDGAAIAAAVLQHLASTICCRGLFATHYHRLADDHQDDANVSVRHMACHVDSAGDCEQVTFLYKLAEGACPKSYGPNVARLAGLPPSLLAPGFQYW